MEAMPEFEILDKGGIDPLLASISDELRVPERQVVGILVDANDNLAARWEEVMGGLQHAAAEELHAPREPDPAGVIIASRPRIGIWLLPNNESPGELEDLVAAMIPKDDTVWPLSEAYVDGIPTTERKFKQGKTLRAKVHSWLATREEPRKMGSAIGAQDLDVTLPHAVRFVDWLRRLYG